MTNRIETVTQRIDRQLTGFKASLYVHVDHANGKPVAVRFADKGKDGSTLDTILTALGDAVTDIIDELANQPPPAAPKNPRVCETPGCSGPKQPGKSHCASCLTKAHLERSA